MRGEEDLQQAQFPVAQCFDARTGLERPCHRIENHPGEGLGVLRVAALTAQNRAATCLQLGKIEGFRYIVVGAQIQQADPVGYL